ncbi:sodium:calcium antiporter [Frateuria aurantia]|uniref:Ca2+/Na+ antiporter n=1 Tax=Frateuria aurantia (strain ATCC 33424 / DSM 6220 / KCTC 2777 / LMG 1558 / NBRC 3245 / NCIMB 13370) TaxID=767434 RepID=H8L5H5_FRAAD|nr:sodium:calcium antiporter [Frateuria aurantia]AFC85776.1 Ca2+/Na+ antiporter [Frateuria aurantia DSM 6220]
MLTALCFILSAVAIYIACEYFVNGIEWLGERFRLGATATGTVLAAFGTALPESAVTAIAVLGGHTPEQKDIGVGAAMGGPLVLATLAYAVVGGALLWHRRKLGRADSCLQADYPQLVRDQRWFLIIFACKCALGLLAFAWKPWLGVLFLLAYALYVWRELSRDQPADEDGDEVLEPLKIRPRAGHPGLGWIVLQTVAAMLVITVASRIFVHQIEAIGTGLQLSAHLVALLLSPVATELPETMNALIWMRQGKERLALANISGAMMIQATIPSALGIFATPWHFDTTLALAGVMTMLAVLWLWLAFRCGRVKAQHLLCGAGFYLAFVLLLVMHLRH